MACPESPSDPLGDTGLRGPWHWGWPVTSTSQPVLRLLLLWTHLRSLGPDLPCLQATPRVLLAMSSLFLHRGQALPMACTYPHDMLLDLALLMSPAGKRAPPQWLTAGGLMNSFRSAKVSVTGLGTHKEWGRIQGLERFWQQSFLVFKFERKREVGVRGPAAMRECHLRQELGLKVEEYSCFPMSGLEKGWEVQKKWDHFPSNFQLPKSTKCRESWALQSVKVSLWTQGWIQKLRKCIRMTNRKSSPELH